MRIISFEKIQRSLISKLVSCLAFRESSAQWNIWGGVFYKTSRQAVPVNNFRKKIHLIFHFGATEFDYDLKTQTRNTHILNYRHIAYDILCCKSHLEMNLKKTKNFTPKKKDSFLMSLFLSSCFYFQTRT